MSSMVRRSGIAGTITLATRNAAGAYVGQLISSSVVDQSSALPGSARRSQRQFVDKLEDRRLFRCRWCRQSLLLRPCGAICRSRHRKSIMEPTAAQRAELEASDPAVLLEKLSTCGP